MSRDFSERILRTPSGMSSAIAGDSEGKCQDTVVASEGDAVDRETHVPLDFASRFRDGRRRKKIFFSLLIDEGSRAAYFCLLVLLRNSRIRLCIRRRKLSFFAFLSRDQSVFIFPSFFFPTSR